MYAHINDRLNAHDYDAVYEGMHPEHRQYVNGLLAAEGKHATRAADDAFYSLVSDLHRVVDDVFGTDDRATCRSTFVGTLADGRRVELPTGAMIYLRDGMVVESWLYADFSVLG
jgi:SnoaL-like domain